MSTNNKNGPAFPLHPNMPSQLGCTPSASDAGMSLRDYFAAKAMQGIMTDPDMVMGNAKLAAWAYGVADAMLEAR